MRDLPFLIAVLAAAPPAPHAFTFRAGTIVQVRFLEAVTSGRDPVGTPVFAQTSSAMVHGDCVIVPPFARISGRVVRSIGGRRLGRSGQLEIRFDSLEIRPGIWLPIYATLDTLEYAPSGAIRDSGVLHARASRLPIVVAAAGSVLEILPAPLFGGYLLARRGARPSILSGEVGAIRLVEPLIVTDPPACGPVAAQRDPQELPTLPRFVPYALDKHGRRTGDAINLIFLGREGQIDSAFRRAGWVAAHPGSLWAITREVTAAVASRPAVGAPVSALYFEGRKEDLAYELAGPNARIRHHVRIWLLDSLDGVWVAAATKDVGLRVKPLHHLITHRIDPHVDRERDVITGALAAEGCADLPAYLHLPGADTVGHTVDGQHFITDGRSAVLRLGDCSPVDPTGSGGLSLPRGPTGGAPVPRAADRVTGQTSRSVSAPVGPR